MEQWSEFILESEQWYRAIYGKTAVFFRYRSGDWRVASIGISDSPSLETLHKWTGSLPDNLVWDRWVGVDSPGDESALMTVRPCMPDRNLAVKLNSVLRIPQGIETTVFLNIPVSVDFKALRPRNGNLGCFPSERLSNTWIGNKDAGILGYSIWTDLIRKQAEINARPWYTTCAITINNISPTELILDRLNLNCELVGLWLTGNQLWTDAVTFTYRAVDIQPQVSISPRPFMAEPDSIRISEPQKEIRRYKFGWKKKGNGDK